MYLGEPVSLRKELSCLASTVLFLAMCGAVACWAVLLTWRLQNTAENNVSRYILASVRWLVLGTCTTAVLLNPVLSHHQNLGLSMLVAGMHASMACKLLSLAVYTREVVSQHGRSLVTLMAALPRDTFFPGTLVSHTMPPRAPKPPSYQLAPALSISTSFTGAATPTPTPTPTSTNPTTQCTVASHLHPTSPTATRASAKSALQPLPPLPHLLHQLAKNLLCYEATRLTALLLMGETFQPGQGSLTPTKGLNSPQNLDTAHTFLISFCVGLSLMFQFSTGYWLICSLVGLLRAAGLVRVLGAVGVVRPDAAVVVPPPPMQDPLGSCGGSAGEWYAL